MPRKGTVKSSIRSKKLQEVRTLAIVDAKIHGRSVTEIAADFGCSPDTVKRSLTAAEKLDLASRYEDYLYGRLGPLALGVYEEALVTDKDTSVATKVLETMGAIRKVKEQPVATHEPAGDTWEGYYKVKATRIHESPPVAQTSNEDDSAGRPQLGGHTAEDSPAVGNVPDPRCVEGELLSLASSPSGS